MRISVTKVVQLVESTPPQLVILDESKGAEIALTPIEMDHLQIAINYFHPYMHQMFKLPGGQHGNSSHADATVQDHRTAGTGLDVGVPQLPNDTPETRVLRLLEMIRIEVEKRRDA